MQRHALKLALAFALATLAAAGPAGAQSPATGIWIDHTGRGAVEITECGANLCGRLVWFKDKANKKGCGVQIIGNARPVGKDTWDGGWILDPEKNEKYSVELKPIGADKLRVMGYMGSKLFSETMIWKRPTVELERCDATPASTAAPNPPADDAAKKSPAPGPDTAKAPPPPAEPKRPDAKGKAAPPPEKEAAKPSECKRYVAQIGESVTVPCDK
jgi:uncharacterized protein (DUF2147 family)